MLNLAHVNFSVQVQENHSSLLGFLLVIKHKVLHPHAFTKMTMVAGNAKLFFINPLSVLEKVVFLAEEQLALESFQWGGLATISFEKEADMQVQQTLRQLILANAASRGLSVALVDAQDFAAGTSSRSSKLVHGGIRYLENMEFKLVFEALNERTKLFEMAPHLVHPLRFMIPLYEDSRVGMFKMGLGMWLYDALALFQAPEMHEGLSASESIHRMPSIRAEKLSGSYIYSDAYMDDDRLVIETLRSANVLGAQCANYVKATGAKFSDDGKIKEVQCEDQITKEKFSIKAKHKRSDSTTANQKSSSIVSC